MAKFSFGRCGAILFFLLLVLGAVVSAQQVFSDISEGKYFTNPQELRHEIIFLASYLLIIIFVLRYGYYLAINKVNWSIVGGDFLYLLNKKYFLKPQWVINNLLFWLALAGFVYSLAIAAMKGML